MDVKVLQCNELNQGSLHFSGNLQVSHLWLVRNEQTLILLFWAHLVIGRKRLGGPGWVHYTIIPSLIPFWDIPTLIHYQEIQNPPGLKPSNVNCTLGGCEHGTFFWYLSELRRACWSLKIRLQLTWCFIVN